MRRLILHNRFSPGDVVMMTAAVRDLHLAHPNEFQTDVRTRCPELWEHNPSIVSLSNEDPGVEEIDCAYPLINQCNWTPYHCLHGYIQFLNQTLNTAIKPTRFHGDIHLSDLEKSWYSQVHELTGEDTPFWIVAAGGKYDVTVKWWSSERYQQVVDHFRGRIQFVQVGARGHHHPKLKGVIDLRGQTHLRELVRLVYHAQGVLGPVTALMHLAAAVETKTGQPPRRACVVVAGGREPAHWEAYPDHQFIHTNGQLTCSAGGGCWKDRTLPLGDGDPRDRPEHLCSQVVGELPRCMDMISSAEVIRRIEGYFRGGSLTYLSKPQWKRAQAGTDKTANNDFDRQPLTLHSARLSCEAFLRRQPGKSRSTRGRGIVICAGGPLYLPCAWIAIRMLRRLGCTLPIELWHLGKREMPGHLQTTFACLDVQCVNALDLRHKHPVRLMGGWPLKAYALLHSAYREILFLDADNVPVQNPEFLFEAEQYRGPGAVFWPDYGREPKADPIWHSCGIPRPPGPEFESGQILIDKSRCLDALRLSLWFNEHADFYYRYLHGDKETFHLAFEKSKCPYHLIAHPIHPLKDTMCQHDFAGARLFQHRNLRKWNLFGDNEPIPDFWYEKECLQDLEALRKLWKPRKSPGQHP